MVTTRSAASRSVADNAVSVDRTSDKWGRDVLLEVGDGTEVGEGNGETSVQKIELEQFDPILERTELDNTSSCPGKEERSGGGSDYRDRNLNKQVLEPFLQQCSDRRRVNAIARKNFLESTTRVTKDDCGVDNIITTDPFLEKGEFQFRNHARVNAIICSEIFLINI